MSGPTLGYNAQLHEVATSWQFLGSGVRIYNPALARFHSADQMSPFGRGGINAYAYCAGDPVNHVDPGGRFMLPIAAILGLGALATGGVAVSKGAGGDSRSAAIFGVIAGGLGVAAGLFAAGRAFKSRAHPRSSPAEVTPPVHGWGMDGEVMVRIRDVEGVRTLSLVGHGYKGGVTWGPNELDGRQLAEQLKKVGTGQARIDHINVHSCLGGAGRRGAVAQVVADEYGVPASAYPNTTYGGWDASGKVTSTSRLKTFYPQTGIKKAASAIRNRELHRRVRGLSTRRQLELM
ncbi:MAG: RHS repeat-associated core domain-containing protein [Pseudomonas sp.]